MDFAIIGAGSRGNAYADALRQCTSYFLIRIAAVAEPIASKRQAFIRRHVGTRDTCRAYESWQQFVEFELLLQSSRSRGDSVHSNVDGVFICTLDETHAEIITALAPLKLHVMSEKPLATTLDDCLRIHRSLQPLGTLSPSALFSVGHVLRYSPHNMLLSKLLVQDNVIGDVLSLEHTEPVGWWHFSHSYVR